MRFFTVVLAFIGFLNISAAQAAPAESIAAVVNDDVITVSDLADRMQMVISSAGLPRTAEFRQRIAPQVLDGLITEQIQIQEAERLDVKIDDEAIERGLNMISSQNKMTADQFKNMLASQGVPIRTLKRQIRAQIAWGEVVQSVLREQVIVSDADVAAEKKRMMGQLNSFRYNLYELVLPVLNPEDEPEVSRLANRLRNEISSGKARFEAVAQQFSQSSSAARGGSIGWVGESQLSPDLQDIVREMNDGEISQPIRTDETYTIILMKQKSATIGELPPDAQITDIIGQGRLERMAERYIRELREQSFIEKRIGG